ncbi:MAG TPA: class I SAM-dependent methyltransferase [Methylomirabilota bacterium]|nr:class I SAM-dependent methyltransferase [Methylomirabilota bacterium]
MERSPGNAPPGVSARYWALLVAEPLRDADVLDVGTGAGRVAMAIAPLCRRILGIDRDAGVLADARRHAADRHLTNVEFADVDAEARADYVDLTPTWKRPTLVVAHLCMSEAIIAAAARTLAAGQRLVFAALHVDQWRETGRRSRFAYDADEVRRQLALHGFAVEHLEVEQDVQRFESVEQGLAAAIGLAEKWKSDGRWFRYIKFLEDGGRTLTRSHLLAGARRT